MPQAVIPANLARRMKIENGTAQMIKGHGFFVCSPGEIELEFLKQTIVTVLATRSGATASVVRRFQTPFILERAKPSKDGDAKLWAFGSFYP